MKYITVLDFEAGRVFQYEIDFFPDSIILDNPIVLFV